jgi:hypothetical protein
MFVFLTFVADNSFQQQQSNTWDENGKFAIFKTFKETVCSLDDIGISSNNILKLTISILFW